MTRPYSNKRFLVIDDHPSARDALRTIAQAIGAFTVEMSSNYQDAIYRIRNNKPDIVLCDYMLSDGRSGQQLLEELRRFDLLNDENVFMMVTGEQSYEQVVSAVELVPDDYIIKPFSPDKLVLRLERIVAKKTFFRDYYREKRNKQFDAALAILEAQRGSDAGRPYQTEILRQRAEVMLAGGDSRGAEMAYRSILEKYEFPWARAGVARALHRQRKLNEAREEIDQVVASTPYFFDAADLKANICMSQGEHDEAQSLLNAVSKRTPRNYLRKRLLAEAATLNGDLETARAAMADVIANDTMPGAIKPADRLALARSHADANDLISAENALALLRESEVQTLTLDEQASYVAILAISTPARGNPRLAGLRPALMSASLCARSRLDVLRAALQAGDHELADYQAEALLVGEDAKKVFGPMRNQYAAHDREPSFRDIQKRVALKRIQHDPPPALAA